MARKRNGSSDRSAEDRAEVRPKDSSGESPEDEDGPADVRVRLPPKDPQRKTFLDIAKRSGAFRPARETLTKVRAVPTIFPDVDRKTRVGGWPIDRVGVVHGPSSHGKAQPIDEIVLTPAGWRPIGELRVGDFVIGSEGKPIRVTGVFPQGVKRIVSIVADDGATARCCEDHLWQTMTTKELNRGRYVRGPRPERARSLTGVEGLGTAKTAKEIAESIDSTHYLPTLTAPVLLQERQQHLPYEERFVPPYYLGLLLGDGGFTSCSVYFTSEDEELLRAVEISAAEFGDRPVRFDYGDRCPGVRITGGVQGDSEGSRTRSALMELGLWGCRSECKFVPAPYLRASPEERMLLLQGLMDTDGGVSNEGQQAQFSTTSPHLRDAVVALVRSLGGRAFVYPKETKALPAWCVMVSFADSRNPFRMARKANEWNPRTRALRQRIVSVEEVGEAECVCISVNAPDHLYVTRDFLLTHNTIFVHGLGLSFLRRGHAYCLIDAEMTTPITWCETLLGAEVNSAGFFALRPKSYEEAVDGVRRMAEGIAEQRVKGALRPDTTALFVVDSIRKLVPEDIQARIKKMGAEGEKGSVDGFSGAAGRMRAALNSAWLDQLIPLMYHTGCAILFVGRESDDPNADARDRQYGNDWKLTGGRALVFDSSLVVRVSRDGYTTIGGDDEKQVVGERHRVEIHKTKVAAHQERIERAYFHTSNGRVSPEGYDRARDVLRLCDELGVVKRSGTWITFGRSRWQGEARYVGSVTTEQLDEMEGAAREKFDEDSKAHAEVV